MDLSSHGKWLTSSCSSSGWRQIKPAFSFNRLVSEAQGLLRHRFWFPIHRNSCRFILGFRFTGFSFWHTGFPIHGSANQPHLLTALGRHMQHLLSEGWYFAVQRHVFFDDMQKVTSFQSFLREQCHVHPHFLGDDAASFPNISCGIFESRTFRLVATLPWQGALAEPIFTTMPGPSGPGCAHVCHATQGCAHSRLRWGWLWHAHVSRPLGRHGRVAPFGLWQVTLASQGRDLCYSQHPCWCIAYIQQGW